MTDIEIPTPLDPMYSTLAAIRDLSGSATRSEPLEKVPEVAGMTDEQVSDHHLERITILPNRRISYLFGMRKANQNAQPAALAAFLEARRLG